MGVEEFKLKARSVTQINRMIQVVLNEISSAITILNSQFHCKMTMSLAGCSNSICHIIKRLSNCQLLLS